MNFEMQKALMLAENINDFIKFVHHQYENKNRTRVEKDKIYQIKLLIEDFKFQVIADELHRINQYSWDEKYTLYLVDGFNKGISIIDEYVKNNYNDLFIFTGRLYTLKNLSSPFS
ncbi:hypothetical protein, partial [Bacillus xiapuensis]|nr:hypothetical protein [Bacillus xiapuensis]